MLITCRPTCAHISSILSGQKPLIAKRRWVSFCQLTLAGGSGLVIYTQDPRIARKLQEDAYALEQELVVGVKGQIDEGGLQRLCHGLISDRQPLPPAKVSWQERELIVEMA